jgi:hypothetical protein
MGNTNTLTDDERTEINQIARRNYCRIEKIDSQTDWIVCSIPKAFSSSVSMRKISILQSSIEIYLINPTTSIPVRLTFFSQFN